MKIKGITVWEQYLERFVLGIAVLVFLVLTALQFIGEPNAADLAGKKIAPGEVDDLLREQARQIQGKLNDPTRFDINPKETVLTKFEQAKSAGVSPQPVLVAWGPNIGLTAGDAIPPGTPFVTPQIEAPYSVAHQQYFETLTDEVLAAHEGLREIVTATPPDVNFITAAAKFNVAKVLAQFSQPGPNGGAPLPPKWYGNSPNILDVKIEREEMDSSGAWGNLITLDHIPGQYDLRPTLAGSIDAPMRDEILTTINLPATRNSITQPEFYAGKANAWLPPTEKSPERAPVDAALSEEQQKLFELKRALERERIKRDRAAKLIKENNCSETEPEEPPKAGAPNKDKGGGGTPSAPGAGGGDGGRSGGLRSPSSTKKEPDACKSHRAKLRSANKKITQLEEEIAKIEGEKAVVEEEPVENVVEAPLPDEMTIWGHDLKVEPGKTYRYRFTVLIYNPLFSHRPDLIAEQQPLAEQFTIASQTSEWSDPIQAAPPLRLWITSARTADQAGLAGSQGLGSATAEVFRFRDGRWWLEKFNVQPGDRIGEEREPAKGKNGPAINYETGWFLLDVVPDESSDGAAGLSATVVLQSLDSEAVCQYRSPRADASDPDLHFLREEEQSARLEDPTDVAAANGSN